MSLKKLPSVSFAGVDSLDDVKNHTYNELFVSGGFMVSDEFVLNPDLITQGESSAPPPPSHGSIWTLHGFAFSPVPFRSSAGAAEVPGGAEHPRAPLAVEGALQVPEEAQRAGEVSAGRRS